MNNLTPEQKRIGKDNFNAAVGVRRRDFLAAAAAAPALGAFYFGYEKLDKTPVRAGIIGTGNEGNVLIRDSNPDYLQFVAFSDIRPSNQKRARRTFQDKYGREARKIKLYVDYKELLADKDIEAVVIAVPLLMHKPIAVDAMRAGKHVLCEKLMARTVAGCKEMARAAERYGRILAVGHQRHYSYLYANALSLIETPGILGTIKHIRALWHRNNTRWDSWKPPIPDEDRAVDVGKYGYKSIEELVRWRLYRRTSGGLMAELGSHQLDACSIFLGKVHPLAVSGVGGKVYFQDDREVEDHVYLHFEFPEGVVVSYSSINTNAFDGYGEQVMGSLGTLIIEREQSAYLFRESKYIEGVRPAKQTRVEWAEKKLGRVVTEASASLTEWQAAQTQVNTLTSRGYREEMEHFAYCIRHPDPNNQPRCNAKVALADAVIALTANIAMRTKRRIEFDPAWFDPKSDRTPEKAFGIEFA